ncbi:unnamed protein product [Caenorhabditis sp. 36 PRJEB53466]|nr:unnamed protein product [Caenorhabditis sp. 36 PRJEB53466]
MAAITLSLFFFFAFFVVYSNGNIGNCDLSAAPPSWLSTNGSGIVDWATAGQPTNGTNFCLQGDLTQKKSIDSSSRRNNANSQNSCINNSSRIVVCFPLCFNDTLQNMVIKSALKSNQPSVVAKDIQTTTNLDWAITVIQVDYNDPNAHLNASVFLVPDAWCSVYIGIKPQLGFDYLYEIQLGKILKS